MPVVGDVLGTPAEAANLFPGVVEGLVLDFLRLGIFTAGPRSWLGVDAANQRMPALGPEWRSAEGTPREREDVCKWLGN